MKKIYLQPQMELTECVMLRAAVCSGGDPIIDNTTPDNNGNDPFAPGRKVF